jgi:hypothetical protein
LLLQSAVHIGVVPQSMVHAVELSQLQLVAPQLPEVVEGVGRDDGGAGAPTDAPDDGLPLDPPQATTTHDATRSVPKRRERLMEPP